MDLAVRRVDAAPRTTRVFHGPGRVVGDLEHARDDRGAVRRRRLGDGRRRRGRRAARRTATRSEPGSPKSRWNASGKTTRSVSSGVSAATAARLSAGSRLAPCCTRATRNGRRDSVTSPTYDLCMAAATLRTFDDFAAVVLSGGTGARLGGADKAALEARAAGPCSSALWPPWPAPTRSSSWGRPVATSTRAGAVRRRGPARRRPGGRAARRASARSRPAPPAWSWCSRWTCRTSDRGHRGAAPGGAVGARATVRRRLPGRRGRAPPARGGADGRDRLDPPTTGTACRCTACSTGSS